MGARAAPPSVPQIDPGSRSSTDVIHRHLRRQILSGDIPAGSELSQAQVAKDCGVSRAPVREAFRLLQREGLIETEINHRARVSPLSLEDVEQTYALRVVNESLALAVSIPRLTHAELDNIDRAVEAVDAAHPDDFEAWEQRHQDFHSLLLRHSGPEMQSVLSQWADHTERYRRVYVADSGGGWTLGAAEHAELAHACRAGDVDTATTVLARHHSRAGLTLIAAIDPSYEPALLRTAVRQVANPDVPTRGPAQSRYRAGQVGAVRPKQRDGRQQLETHARGDEH